VVDDVSWMRFGVFDGREKFILRAEFEVFSRVLMKLWCMDEKRRKFDPCWRALKALVYVVEGPGV